MKRGKLKVFFGYAAGVGKTYTILTFAHSLLEQGVDVVAGYIESHEREETKMLLEGLEEIPPKKVHYRNIKLLEFDIDAALERHPEVILVDELAHSNAPGSRHDKRYEDIQELLKAGVTVYTTVNVQHLEGLNDLVGEITGVEVVERIPDFVFDQADQVELVDIEPEELLERLKQGKIYKSEQATRALQNFFTVDHLVSLRETALRRMADRVNLHLSGKAAEGEGKVGEHIMICLSSSPSNQRVIRQGARMANAFRGKFTALFVETSEYSSFSKANLVRLRENKRLAEQLGAKVVTSFGNDIVEQIAEYARIARVTKLVLGRTYTKRSWFAIKERFSDRIMRLEPNLEVFLIPDVYEKKYSGSKKRQVKFETKGMGRDILVLMTVLISATGISYLFQEWKFSDANIIMAYILGVLLIAMLTKSKIFSVLASFASVLLFDLCFTPPIGTLTVTSPSNFATILIMLATVLISGSLTQKVKGFARQAAHKAYRTEVLLQTSQKLQRCTTTREIAFSTARQLHKLLERTIIFYEGDPANCEEPIIFKGHQSTAEVLNNQILELDKPKGKEEKRSNSKTELEEIDNKTSLEVAQWVYVNNKHAGFSTSTLPGSPCLFLSIRNGDKVFGVVGIHMRGKEMESLEEGMMIAILNECALALEKAELLKKRKETEIKLEQEKLRADLLRSISHDLRTPLTSISGNAGILMVEESNIDFEKRHKLYEDIYDDSMWLINLVENLLSITRIENGTMELNLKPELLDDVIQEAIKHVNRKAEQYHLVVEQEDDFMVARMDVRLILQVIINLVDNAIKYTPKGSTITIKTKRGEGFAIIEVCDNGPGILPEQKEHLFDLFYTGSTKISDGRRSMGMGLSLCKSIINAHGGDIEIYDNVPFGAIFRFALKEEEVTM